MLQICSLCFTKDLTHRQHTSFAGLRPGLACPDASACSPGGLKAGLTSSGALATGCGKLWRGAGSGTLGPTGPTGRLWSTSGKLGEHAMEHLVAQSSYEEPSGRWHPPVPQPAFMVAPHRLMRGQFRNTGACMNRHGVALWSSCSYMLSSRAVKCVTAASC